MFTLQGELDRYEGLYGGSMGYGGAQAGTGTGGVGGVGPTTVHSDGSVSTGNETTTQTLPDGTVVVTTVKDGLRNQHITTPDGTQIFSQEHDGFTD
jgi:hypothetical protein